MLWIAALIVVVLQPVQFPELSQAVKAALAGNPEMFYFLDPNEINIGARLQEIVIFVIVAGTLGLASRRANELLIRQASASRERANLARYFPPGIVEQLAAQDEPLGAVRAQPVAIMFADIVGFTRIAEGQSPGQVVGFLRDFHARLERCVFDHGGTLDKFLGDGIMATFGTPVPSPARRQQCHSLRDCDDHGDRGLERRGSLPQAGPRLSCRSAFTMAKLSLAILAPNGGSSLPFSATR